MQIAFIIGGLFVTAATIHSYTVQRRAVNRYDKMQYRFYAVMEGVGASLMFVVVPFV